MSLFLSSGGVKENRKILLCKNSGGAAETVRNRYAVALAARPKDLTALASSF